MKQCINGLRSIDAIQPAACLNVVMMWLFIYCYFGDQMTSRFENIQSTLYLCQWYLLPNKLEKSIPMILRSSQKSIYLQGFGSNSCTRETFKKVFLMLKIDNKNELFYKISLDCQCWFLLFYNAPTSATKCLIYSEKNEI